MLSDPGVPGVPQNLHIDDMTKSSVTLAWDKPDFDGGSPITGYHVERCQAYSTRWTRASKTALTSPMFTIKNLIEGEEYEFRVIAENDAGLSKPSDSTGTFVAQDPYTKPGKAGKPEVRISKDTAIVSWMPPADDGRSPITNYVIDRRAAGEIRWKTCNTGEKVKDTSYTVTGLEPGVEYEFRVSAENKAGAGLPSNSSGGFKYGECILGWQFKSLTCVIYSSPSVLRPQVGPEKISYMMGKA